jgi:hypothetical protein
VRDSLSSNPDAYPAFSPRAVIAKASSSPVAANWLWDFMNEVRSSAMNLYRPSGLSVKNTIAVEIMSRRSKIKVVAAFRIHRTTPITPVTMSGWSKTLVKIRRNMALMKFTAQIAILKAFIFLSIHGRKTEAVIRAPASISSNAIAWTVPAFWAKAMKKDFSIV